MREPITVQNVCGWDRPSFWDLAPRHRLICADVSRQRSGFILKGWNV